MKNINNQIRAAKENTENLMLGEFNFHLKQILNKILILYITLIREEIKIEQLTLLMTHIMIDTG